MMRIVDATADPHFSSNHLRMSSWTSWAYERAGRNPSHCHMHYDRHHHHHHHHRHHHQPRQGIDTAYLLGRGHLPGTDGPDGLICDDHMRPFGDLFQDGVQLSHDDFARLTGLSFLQLFPNAQDHLESLLQRERRLGRDQLAVPVL